MKKLIIAVASLAFIGCANPQMNFVVPQGFNHVDVDLKKDRPFGVVENEAAAFERNGQHFSVHHVSYPLNKFDKDVLLKNLPGLTRGKVVYPPTVRNDINNSPTAIAFETISLEGEVIKHGYNILYSTPRGKSKGFYAIAYYTGDERITDEFKEIINGIHLE